MMYKSGFPEQFISTHLLRLALLWHLSFYGIYLLIMLTFVLDTRLQARRCNENFIK